MGQSQLAAGEGNAAPVPTRGNDKAVGGQMRAVAQLDGVLVDKMRAAGIEKDAYAGRLQVAAKLLLLMQPVNDTLRAGDKL